MEHAFVESRGYIVCNRRTPNLFLGPSWPNQQYMQKPATTAYLFDSEAAAQEALTNAAQVPSDWAVHFVTFNYPSKEN